MGRGLTKDYHKVLNKSFVKGTMTCLKPSVIKRIINTDFPNILNIEPTNSCNFRCFYCPRTKAKKGVGFMDWKLYRRLIDEAAEHRKLIMLNLHKDGESFLHPKFIDMIIYAKEKDIARRMHVNTNAFFWTDKVIDRLLDSGIDDITISLDAADPETYKRHKGIDCLLAVENRVIRFFNRRKKLGLSRPFTRVKIMEFDDITPNEISRFFDKWDGLADMVQVTGAHNWSGAIEGFKVTDETSEERFPCAITWYSLVVNWNGQVTACSVDWDTQINLGNANEQGLSDIWTSSRIKRLRKAQLELNFKNFPVCKDCVVWVSVGNLDSWLSKREEFYS